MKKKDKLWIFLMVLAGVAWVLTVFACLLEISRAEAAIEESERILAEARVIQRRCEALLTPPATVRPETSLDEQNPKIAVRHNRKPPPMEPTSRAGGQTAKSNNYTHYMGGRKECQA